MSVQLCRGFTDVHWQQLRPKLLISSEGAVGASWELAIEVFRRRMSERYFFCIEALELADHRLDVGVDEDVEVALSMLPAESSALVPGFAIVGLCCLLLETLSTFRETEEPEKPAPIQPCSYPSGPCTRPMPMGTSQRIQRFLQRSAFNSAFDGDIAARFVNGVRNGILHNAETRGWTIWREEPVGHIVGREGDQLVLNRSLFVSALLKEFQSYIEDLESPRNVDLRVQFLTKMDHIVSRV